MTPSQIQRLINDLEYADKHRHINGVLISSKRVKLIIKALKELKHNEEGHMELYR